MRYPRAAILDPFTPKLSVEGLLRFFSTEILPLIDQSVCDGSVAVDAAVAQERPVASNVFQSLQVHVADQNLLAIVRSFRQHASKRIAEERSTPELKPLSRSRFATDVSS